MVSTSSESQAMWFSCFHAFSLWFLFSLTAVKLPLYIRENKHCGQKQWQPYILLTVASQERETFSSSSFMKSKRRNRISLFLGHIHRLITVSRSLCLDYVLE